MTGIHFVIVLGFTLDVQGRGSVQELALALDALDVCSR